jgi:hypothetical protein
MTRFWISEWTPIGGGHVPGNVRGDEERWFLGGFRITLTTSMGGWRWAIYSTTDEGVQRCEAQQRGFGSATKEDGKRIAQRAAQDFLKSR